MYSQLLSNIWINFKFYRRNRLLWVASIFIIFALGLSTIPAIFYFSESRHLGLIIMTYNQLSQFTTIIISGLGLLFISHHISNRLTKMVFTKPCTPEIWLLSGLFSASIVSLVLYALIFLICSILFIVWNIPLQWGIFYISLNDFLNSLIILSYITFLAVIFHPAIAVIFIFIFRDDTFYFLKIVLGGGISASPYLKVLKGVVDIIYMIIPSFNPFAEKKSHVYSSLRASGADWIYILLTFVYTLMISSFFYLLCNYFLKRKRHI